MRNRIANKLLLLFAVYGCRPELDVLEAQIRADERERAKVEVAHEIVPIAFNQGRDEGYGNGYWRGAQDVRHALMNRVASFDKLDG